MLQASVSDCLFFDLLPFSQDDFVAPEVDVSGCDVVQTLVVALVVVVVDEGADLTFKIAGQIVVLQQHPVFHGLMPAFNLALGLRMEWCAPNMIHLPACQPFGQVAGDVARSIVAEQARLGRVDIAKASAVA